MIFDAGEIYNAVNMIFVVFWTHSFVTLVMYKCFLWTVEKPGQVFWFSAAGKIQLKHNLNQNGLWHQARD